MQNTTHALKEWATAIAALETGKTILLLRKGGIKEVGGRFQVQYPQALLYPTYEHQKPELLKPEYAAQVNPVASGWHPETVSIGSWANITDIFSVTQESVVDRLLPYHIWNEKLVSDRLHWKPRQPLYLLLLRVYKLPQRFNIPYAQEYGGCKSWLDLQQPISLEGSIPILNEPEYTEQVEAIRQIVTEAESISKEPVG
jgi:hypothetical protein